MKELSLVCGKGAGIMGKERIWVTKAVRMVGILATISSVCSFMVQHVNANLPSKISVVSGQEETLSFEMPVTGVICQKDHNETAMAINLSEPITLKADELTSYELKLQLFGLFALKDVELEIVEQKEMIPAGIPIGIYLETEGVLVVDTGEVEGTYETTAPSKYILQQGDYILAVNGEKIEDKSELVEQIQECEGESLVFTIKRKQQVFDTKVTPKQNKEGTYQAGIWVKDNVQGIGTLTYVDTLGSFGALGHGIHDNDTGNRIEMESGSLYATEIIAVKKGKMGEPGELTGVIDYSKYYLLGDVYFNTESGILGTCNQKLMQQISQIEALPIGYKHKVKLGPAQIVCSVDGERKLYDIEITALHYDAAVENKGLEIQVTDEALLQITGGIVQGMSGSPILQDGKIVGAVTHVLVNDPTRGYGIFIENMLEY